MCLLEIEGDEQILTVYLCLPLGILCLPACLLEEVSVSQNGAMSILSWETDPVSLCEDGDVL